MLLKSPFCSAAFLIVKRNNSWNGTSARYFCAQRFASSTHEGDVDLSHNIKQTQVEDNSAILKNLNELCVKLTGTSSMLEKRAILKQYPQCCPILEYIYSPFKTFGIKSSAVKKEKKKLLKEAEKKSSSVPRLLEDTLLLDLTTLLDAFINGSLSGRSAAKAALVFVEANRAHEELIFKIIDKNLKTRTGARVINSVYPKLIPEFNVSLAHTYDPNNPPDFVNKKGEHIGWYCSRKLDGVRCLSVVRYDGMLVKINFFSRTGKPIETLSKLGDMLSSTLLKAYKNTACDLGFPRSFVLDGEVCSIPDGCENEEFSYMMKELRKKKHRMEAPKLFIFDMIPLKEFESGLGSSLFNVRLKLMRKLMEYVGTEETQTSGQASIELLDQERVFNESDVSKRFHEALSNGWEGIILRQDGVYEGKRTRKMLKLKEFKDEEFVVQDIEIGKMRLFDEYKKEVEVETLRNIVVKFKGEEVRVGSGFTAEQRMFFYQKPQELLGAIVTIQYFAESKDKDGKPSLRFPTLKYIHGRKRSF